MLVGAATNVGKREHNEDVYCSDEQLRLWLVADGMGGYQAGEVASDIACKSISRQVYEGVALNDAVANAHHEIIAAGQEGIGVPGMGSTIVAVQFSADSYQVSWVGDSRIYRYFNHQLSQLSTDHSVVQELVDAGIVAPEDALNHPQRNLVTQALGVLNLDAVAVDSQTREPVSGERILLCSDGLSDVLDESQIADILGANTDNQIAADKLCQQAVEQGGSDNVTVVVITVTDDDIELSIEQTKKAEPISKRLFFALLGGLSAVALIWLLQKYLT